MLIILHGTAAIRKHYLGCAIMDEMSKNLDLVEVDGYSFDFSKTPIEASKDGVVVYRPATVENDIDDDEADTDGVNTLIWEEGGQDIIDQAIEAHGAFEKIHVPSDLNFDNLYNDLGIGDTIEDDLDAPTVGDDQWNSFMDLINAKPNVLMAGSFSPYYINEIANAYSNGEVKVINVLRNPSAAYLIMGEDDDDSLLYSLHINQLLMDTATNVKFEDIIVNQSLDFNDIAIAVDEYSDFNGIVSVFESNLNPSDKGVDTFNAEYNNLITELGYTPLDYETIISPRS